ncbi:MAG TPA: hypothetical protein VH475_28075 [Tepidisphaeraceae bacterium]
MSTTYTITAAPFALDEGGAAGSFTVVRSTDDPSFPAEEMPVTFQAPDTGYPAATSDDVSFP